MEQHPDLLERPEEQTVMDSVAEMHWKQHYVDQQIQHSDQSSSSLHSPWKKKNKTYVTKTKIMSPYCYIKTKK
jgi:hypothetical protein